MFIYMFTDAGDREVVAGPYTSTVELNYAALAEEYRNQSVGTYVTERMFVKWLEAKGLISQVKTQSIAIDLEDLI